MASFIWASLMVLYLAVDGNALNVGGLVPSVFTPFDDHSQLNLSVIPQYAEYLKKNNVDGALGEYVPFVKAAMEYISGIKVGSTRDPVARISEEQKKILHESIRKMNT